MNDPIDVPACRACSAPFAPDQRYCLQCGARVGERRLPHLELLWGDAAPAASAAATPRPPLVRRLDRIGGPMGAAAVVLVALGAGYLFGQGGAGGPATVIQRPPVVNVQGAGALAPTAATPEEDPSEKAGKRKRGSKEADTSGVPTATDEQTSGDLNKLEQQPDEVATEGEAPPTDDKPAGGGTEVETIG